MTIAYESVVLLKNAGGTLESAQYCGGSHSLSEETHQTLPIHRFHSIDNFLYQFERQVLIWSGSQTAGPATLYDLIGSDFYCCHNRASCQLRYSNIYSSVIGACEKGLKGPGKPFLMVDSTYLD